MFLHEVNEQGDNCKTAYNYHRVNVGQGLNDRGVLFMIEPHGFKCGLEAMDQVKSQEFIPGRWFPFTEQGEAACKGEAEQNIP